MLSLAKESFLMRYILDDSRDVKDFVVPKGAAARGEGEVGQPRAELETIERCAKITNRVNRMGSQLRTTLSSGLHHAKIQGFAHSQSRMDALTGEAIRSSIRP